MKNYIQHLKSHAKSFSYSVLIMTATSVLNPLFAAEYAQLSFNELHNTYKNRRISSVRLASLGYSSEIGNQMTLRSKLTELTSDYERLKGMIPRLKDAHQTAQNIYDCLDPIRALIPEEIGENRATNALYLLKIIEDNLNFESNGIKLYYGKNGSDLTDLRSSYLRQNLTANLALTQEYGPNNNGRGDEGGWEISKNIEFQVYANDLVFEKLVRALVVMSHTSLQKDEDAQETKNSLVNLLVDSDTEFDSLFKRHLGMNEEDQFTYYAKLKKGLRTLETKIFNTQNALRDSWTKILLADKKKSHLR